jgi:pectate lyase-like protein
MRRAVVLVIAVLGCGGSDADDATGTGGGASSSTTASGGSGAGGGQGGTPITTDALPEERRAPWSPGIPGGIPMRSTVCATVDAALGDGNADATAAIQAAIDGCPEGEVVSLPAGSYRTTGTLSIEKGIVLRGAGPESSHVVLDDASVDSVLRIGGYVTYDPGVAITGGMEKGSTTLSAPSASFAPGDVVVVDQLDDPALVTTGDCTFFKRMEGGARSVGQLAEVVAANGDTIELATPLYMSFSAAFAPEVARLTNRVSGAGVEDLKLSRNSDYGGQGTIIHMVNASSSWARSVETYKTSGRSIALQACHHCVVRDSFVHHAWIYDSGGNAYGITLDQQTADSLVENNIVYYFDIPVMFAASGGGNVVAYNYVDDALLGEQPDWPMPDIDSHCSFSHMELVEGNWAGRVMMDNTHGGAGYVTVYRNHLSGTHLTVPNGTWLAPIFFMSDALYMNVLGNVLWNQDIAGVYEDAGCGDNAVYRLGNGLGGDICGVDPRVQDTVLRHGNFDWVSAAVVWDPAIESHDLPPSLYLASKPAFLDDAPWPLFDPDHADTPGTLPAKARFEAIGMTGP